MIVAEKKKRYGITRLSKEESRRLKERTEDKVTLALARGNYWKRYREGHDEDDEEETAKAWAMLRESILSLGRGMSESEEEHQEVDEDGQGAGGLGVPIVPMFL